MISVVMSIYNEPIEWIRESIDSILNQTYKDFEFIIVNDNPLRIENRVLLNDYASKDKRIRLIENVTNLGLTKSLNIAVKSAKGEFIARMDADDISLPQRFEKQIVLMQNNPDCDYTASDAIIFSKGKEDILRKTPKDNNELARFLFTSNPICHPSVIIKSQSVNQEHMYDEECLKSQDYELWLRFFVGGKKYIGLTEPLIKYRMSDQQISTKQVDSQALFASLAKKKTLISYLKKIGFKRSLNHRCLIDNIIQCINNKKNFDYIDKTIIFYLFMSKNRSIIETISMFIKSIFKYKIRIRHSAILVLSIFTTRYNGNNISKEIKSLYE